MKTEEHDEYTLTYNDAPEDALKAYEILLEWFKKHGHFTGESIHQSDWTYEDAPALLTRLAEEVFGFKQNWKP